MLAQAFRNAIDSDQPLRWSEALIVSCAALMAAVPIIAGLYIVKSALGINLMAGPSPLHDLLYNFVV